MVLFSWVFKSSSIVIGKALETLTSEFCNTATRKSRCRLKPFNFAQMGSFTLDTKKFVQFAGVLYFSKISLRLSVLKSAQNFLLTIFATLSEMAGPKPSEGL